MARRSNTARDIVEIVSALPWWVGVALAAVSFLLFSALAGQPVVSTSAGGPKINLIAVIAGVLRYIAPVLFLMGAVTSAFGRSQRRALIGSAQRDGARAVSAMGWQDFELLVGEAFRQRGYTVVETGGGGPDGGVDLLLKREGERALVQCKHWKTWRVGVAVVREMLGAMTAQQASQGWIVTSGRFTAEARAFARQHRIELVDGDGLAALLKGGPSPRSAHVGAPMTASRAVETASAPVGQAALDVPACPVCSRPMVRRVARKGTHVGQSFWGCSGFAEGCRGTRPGP